MLLQRKIKLQSIAPLNIKKRKLNKYLMDQDECDPPGFKEAAPLFEDPAISAIFKRKLCLDEHTMQNLKNPLEPENDEMPPGFMSPEMVERQRQELIENAKRWFPVYLDVQKSKQEKTIEFRSEKLDSRQTMMSRWEQEGISRIHLSQLTTEFPDVEDYYYRTYIKRTKATQGSNSSKKMPIFFPIPTPNQFRSVKAANARDAAIKQKESNGIFSSPERKEEEKKNKRTVEKKDREIAEKEALVKALGKNTASSARKPRRQLQVPFSMVSDFAEEYTAINGKYSLSATIESCFSAVLTLEDLNNLVITLRPKLQDASELDADVAEAQGRLHSLLNSIFFTGFDDESPCKFYKNLTPKTICCLRGIKN